MKKAFKLFGVFIAAMTLTMVSCDNKDDVKIIPTLTLEQESKTFPAEAASYSVNIKSNSAWKIDETTVDFITDISPAEGSGDANISFKLKENTAGERKGSITIKTVKTEPIITVVVEITQEAKKEEPAALKLSETAIKADFAEAIYTVQLESNASWTVTMPEGVSVIPENGTGNAELKISIADNTTESEVTKTLKFASDKEPKPSVELVITQTKPELSYGDATYKVVKMKDGRWWMAENLRYLPEGKTPSDDPEQENDIWYPADFAKKAITDPAEIVSRGYYYSAKVALGVEVTEENRNKLEKVQGICPEGWYIPTEGETDALISKYLVEGTEKDADLDKLNTDGFNAKLVGMRKKNNSADPGSYSPGSEKVQQGWIWTSTSRSKVNSKTGEIPLMARVMSLIKNNKYNRLIVSDGSYTAGFSVRCIKK